LQALLAGVFLAVMPAPNYTALSATAGLLIALYALAVPLRLGRSVFSRAFAGLVLRGALVLAALAVTAHALGILANSHVDTVAYLGSGLFLALVVAVALGLGALSVSKAPNAASAAVATSQGIAAHAVSQLYLLKLVLPGTSQPR
jgi:hypothetical protein